MNHESLSIQNLASSAFPLSAFASLVGGEGLSEKTEKLIALSDNPSPPTSHNYSTDDDWYDNRNRSLTVTLYFYHSDHLGTPIAMTDTSGTLVWRAEHTPFGSIYALPVFTVGNNLRFPGQYYDGETGLAQNWFRDYEAKIGRYWEVDPVGRQDAPNPFPYAGSNTTIVVDPIGLKTFLCSKPLRALGGTGRKSGPDICWNPFYHEYLCIVFANGTIVCGGQDRLRGSWGPGKPSKDDYSPINWDEVSPDDSCLESCLLNGFNQPRPYYGLVGPGTNCQEWANDLLATCQRQCKKKPECASTPTPQPKGPDITKWDWQFGRH